MTGSTAAERPHREEHPDREERHADPEGERERVPAEHGQDECGAAHDGQRDRRHHRQKPEPDAALHPGLVRAWRESLPPAPRRVRSPLRGSPSGRALPWPAVTGPDETPGSAAVCDVSVVLPVYNEKGHLRTEIDRIRAALEASPYSYEIIVVDDGSNDGSEIELASIPDIRLIRHATNRGSGSARRTGTAAAVGSIVVWTDADMTYPNDEIPALVKSMDGYDQVVGRPPQRGRHGQVLPGAGEVVHPLAGQLPGAGQASPT